MKLKACITTLACFVAAAVQAQQAVPDTTGPVALEPVKIEAETLKRLPVRGVQAVVGLMPGVVTLDGALHIRGGRADEIGYTVNGMTVNRPMTGLNNNFTLIFNAIESVAVSSGGYNASQSGRLSGLVAIRTKTGGDRLKLTGEIISDDFWKVKGDDGGLRVLGLDDTYSYGYNDYILTLGGPVPGVEGLRFFAAGQVWNRASAATRFQGFQQDSLELIQTWYKSDGSTVEDTLSYFADIPPGRLPGGGPNGWLMNSNLVYKNRYLSARLDLGYSHERNRSLTSAPTGLITTPLRPYNQTWDLYQAALHIDFNVSEKTQAAFSGGWWHRFYEGSDIKWGDNVLAYGNPERNPALLESSVTRSFDIPFDDAWSIIYPETPSFSYQKNHETRWQFKLDMQHSINDANMLQWGVDYSRETIRRYSVAARRLYSRWLDIQQVPEYATDYDLYTEMSLMMIGYDYRGNKVNEDETYATFGWPRYRFESYKFNARNRPMTPSSLGAYLQHSAAFSDLNLTVGLRFDQYKNGWWSINNWAFMTQDVDEGLSEDNLGPEKSYTLLQPRVALSIPAGDKTVLHARYGHYSQAADPGLVWANVGYNTMIAQIFRASYFQILCNPNLEPSTNRIMEGGVDMMLSNATHLDITAYFKECQGNIGTAFVLPDCNAAYPPPAIYDNLDYGSSWGMTVSLEARPCIGMHMSADYTYSRSIATGSDATTHSDIIWAENDPHYPRIPYLNDYDVRHELNAWLQWCVPAGGGLSILGLNPFENTCWSFTGTARSGMPYTPIGDSDALSQVYGYNAPHPISTMNGYSKPWFWQVDMTLSKAFRLGPVKLEAYVWAINLFDTKSVVDVFRQTGSNTTDGWLNTEEGQNKVEDRGEEWVKWYQADLTNCGTFGWQPPRQLRAGLRFEL